MLGDDHSRHRLQRFAAPQEWSCPQLLAASRRLRSRARSAENIVAFADDDGFFELRCFLCGCCCYDACKGEVCVPLDKSARAGGGFDLVATADRLGMAIVADADAGLWSIGPESFGGRSLATAEAPELSLPDVLTGKDVKLSSFRGKKVVLASWAPY